LTSPKKVQKETTQGKRKKLGRGHYTVLPKKKTVLNEKNRRENPPPNNQKEKERTRHVEGAGKS